jgi:hypothetical protein
MQGFGPNLKVCRDGSAGGLGQVDHVFPEITKKTVHITFDIDHHSLFKYSMKYTVQAVLFVF